MATPRTCITIGIDLGTTYSCAAVFMRNEARIVQNPLGNRTTPSWVLFEEESGYVVGEVAKTKGGKNAVYDSKRILGKEYTDPVLQEDTNRWPFPVFNVEGLPKIQVEARQGQLFSPEEISSYILRSLKEQAEKKFRAHVTGAVITVPAYFNNSQRKATMDAAKLAGLEVLRLLSEPLAAAIAYGLEKETKEETILVFDLGGGTYDLSVVKINNGSFNVQAINGDTHLGGEDFTNNLFDYARAEFKTKYDITIPEDSGYMRQKCDEAKKNLSFVYSADIFYNETKFIRVSRSKFEELNEKLFSTISELLQQVLDDAGLKKWAIDEVLMTGGSVRMPNVIQIVQDFFDDECKLNVTHDTETDDLDVRDCVDLDEIVARGAAIVAANLAGDKSTALKNVDIQDVTPLSLGVEVSDKSLFTVVKRNTPIPLTSPQVFTTGTDDQTSALFTVYEGERPIAKNNTFLGKFIMDNIPPSPRGVPQLDCVFEIDRDGILTVRVTLRGTTNSNQIVIRREGRMGATQIRECILQTEELLSLDAKTRVKQAAKNKLEQYIYDVRKKVRGLPLKEDTQRILIKCDRMMSWLNGQDLVNEESHDEKKKENLYESNEYENKVHELARVCSRQGITL